MSRSSQQPMAGSVVTLHFATALLGTAPTSAGNTLGTWAVPTGARFNIFDVQAFTNFSGSVGQANAVSRVNVFQGSTSVLSSELSLATGSSTSGTLTAAVVPVESGVVISATGTGGFAGSARGSDTVQIRVTGYFAAMPNAIYGNFGFANPTTQPSTGP